MPEPLLELRGLFATLGNTCILHGVDLTLASGCLAVVGRNGVGKSTLCRSIMGLVPDVTGRLRLAGQELLGRPPHEMEGQGVAIVPQGRRTFPSLTVHEHLRLAQKSKAKAWTIERVYQTFPRLAERRRNRGTQLSGGEQQMLAIGRALLRNPRLLILDEPSEGLSPLVVEQLSALMQQLYRSEGMTLLLVEQNFRVAVSVAERVAVMISGRIVHEDEASSFASDHEAHERFLGLGEAA
ncbi:ABC transporter ATP-binding protein [Bradyrhizobium sp. WYCCWR 13023]|uniref:ABC transporter ATP-binding protein n=1 Tax=Bradyrhizobium zhengyangense TaxID=2911009 RepID=A0A9X1RIV1_9BRAD|nr:MULTISPECIES: ABC transporter ATP-binding protein [Bradyrhizobium]MCG2632480.1 ABC transporter ATP-binding protein [Bradyrhizobium zhengyangense]MCG2672967.1 ABC transporter ATP-binding protein [Bradyrhizobium zhengyangense]MDA9521507.1 ABC transporter ATP-binding protein [Bradyrhizobium sp. CCBAU 11434]